MYTDHESSEVGSETTAITKVIDRSTFTPTNAFTPQPQCSSLVAISFSTYEVALLMYSIDHV